MKFNVKLMFGCNGSVKFDYTTEIECSSCRNIYEQIKEIESMLKADVLTSICSHCILNGIEIWEITAKNKNQCRRQKRLGYKKPYKIIASEAISKLFSSLLEKEGGE
jgi:hypothetical protein